MNEDIAAARGALVASLNTVGIKLDDDAAGKVMQALRKHGYRIRKMSPRQLEKYRQRLDGRANGGAAT